MQQEKQEMEKQLLALQQQLQQQRSHTNPSLQNPLQANTTVPAQSGTPPLSTALDNPNLILGVVKDSRGNVLQNILIEVKDQEGNPVRAFKTNAKGAFASATPLLNGTYTVIFEDPKQQQQFQPVKITANGGVLPPLEIISVDERENLRKSLFG